MENIKKGLKALHDTGTGLTVITARAVILATILCDKPEVLDYTFHDGSQFRASESFIRGFLHGTLNWSMRRATQATQKLPKDWEEQCERSFLRKAYVIKEEDIPIEIYINSDQTQVVYSPGNRMTWAPSGSKQVQLVGVDEKRAFTLLVSVSASGNVLPFQAIYAGKSPLSCPRDDARHIEDVQKAGFHLVPSGTTTYWSNLETMKDFVTYILAPYFTDMKAKLGLPKSQKSLWQIDVWSVHRSQVFRDWMKKTHLNIILDFVPGGCTGVHQPCDVGIQRVLKHSIRRSYLEGVMEEFREQLEKNGNISGLDSHVGNLRNHSVKWIWDAYQSINKPELVKKVISCSLYPKNVSS